MTNYSISKIGLGVLLACGAIHAHAEVAGRVLVAVGDTVAVRNGAVLKLAAGTVVESGDLLRVGDASNMQVRFSDEAIVALRPNTDFQIEKYSFANKPESDSTVVSLLKGGMRTITGLIGRNSRANYAVKAQTSTIGIRGTHFTIVHCADDCRNADGSLAPNGTFGGVTDGRIAVTNDAGEREFGKDQYFFVSSRANLPEGLMAPPTFLRDRLEGQAKSPGKGQQAASKETVTADAGSTDTNVSATPANTAATTAVVAQAPANVTENIVAQNAVNPFTGYTDFAFAVSGPLETGDGNTLRLSGAVRDAEVARLKEVYPRALLESLDQGFSAEAGNARWGRWMGSATSIGEHWAVAVPTQETALPVSGTYIYNPVGGTSPTDNHGNVGVVSSQGQVVANFTTKLVGTSKPVIWTVGGHDYSLSLTGKSINGNGSGTGTVTVSCGTCTSATGSVSGNFTGTQGEGIIAGLYTSASFGDVTQTTGQVRVYSTSMPVATPPVSAACTTFPCTRSYALVGSDAQSHTYSSGNQALTAVNSGTTGGQYSVTVQSSSIPLALDPPGLVELGMALGDNAHTVSTTNQGSNAVANLSWRRYNYTETSPDINVHAVHMLHGDAVVALPTSGSYTFSHVGGTVPTDHLGNAGTLNSAGSWNVDFATKTMGTASAVSWTVNGVSYNLNVPNQAWISASQSSSGSEAFGSYTSTITQMGISNISLTCSPNCTVPVGPDSGNSVSPAFMGSSAQALGVGYSTNVVVGGTNQVTSHVQAYKR